MVACKQNETVRIIAGRWRRRLVHFPANEAVRPTADRIRETVFNWLAPHIKESHCLDLFAGSGALGFEALSRGADTCCFVDQSSKVIHCLREAADTFQCQTRARIIQAQVPSRLLDALPAFDIVFLDPPFAQDLLLPSFEWLQSSGYVKSGTLVYLEAEKNLDLSSLKGIEALRSKCTKSLQYQLVKIL